MLLDLIQNIGSMVVSPKRMPGRSWGTELFMRTTLKLFESSSAKGLPWLRERVDKGAGYHPAVSKASMNTHDVAGVTCMLASPKAGTQSDTVVVYFHGGGYVSGSPQSHVTLIAQLAVQTGGLVIAPDYRLAPEHPFPASQDDCLKVAEAAIKTYTDKRIIIAGDSAGGALAIATTLDLHKGQAHAVDKLLLLSPWVDPTAAGGSITRNEKNDFLLASFLNEHFANLMQGEDVSNPRVNFTQVDLSSLPKTLVQCGGGELFLDQIEAFSQRAKSVGVELELVIYPTQFHVFQLFSAVLSDAKQAITEMVGFIRSPQ